MPRTKYQINIDTDQGDLSFDGSWMQFIQRNSIVKESKLVEMVDELDLWTDIGGSLEVDDVHSDV